MGDMADWLTDNAVMPDEGDGAPCLLCYGSGKIGKNVCPRCEGNCYDPETLDS